MSEINDRADVTVRKEMIDAPPGAASTVATTPSDRPAPGPAVGMTMAQLKRNYQAILKAEAIFYPVVFQFTRRLGQGRQGVVFLGLRQGARGCITEHAIKVFDPSIYRSPEEYWTDMGRIASQISRLQGVQTPNLVARHSYEETYGIGYSQMEAIDGIDLSRFLRGDHVEIAKERCSKLEWAHFRRTLFVEDGDRLSLSPGVVVYILRRMLRGIERLHSEGFLHCDIKPGNVMIDRLGIIRLVDFGRAVLAGERVSFLLGSPMYMAPETHQRKPGGFESDFFSVGLVAIEMLTGEPIVSEDEIDEDKLLAVKSDLQDNLSDILPPHVTKMRSLKRIIRRLIETEPSNRYGSAKEVEVGDGGLSVVDKQFMKAGVDAEFGRELSDYLSKFIDDRTGRVELGPPAPDPAEARLTERLSAERSSDAT